MSEEKALLGAIWAEPHEDTPRLVYADWLQETGDPVNVARAEFIRIQCQRAHLEEDDRQQPALEQQEEQLWKKHARKWKNGLPKLLQTAPFHRGFPHPQPRSMTRGKFLKLTMEELAPAPLWGFRLTRVDRTVAKVLASPLMARVGSLELVVSNYRNREKEILGPANFIHLRSLMIGSTYLNENAMDSLAANSSIRHLSELNLINCELTDSAIAHLVTAPWFPSLRSLWLSQNQFGGPGLCSIINHTTSDSLRHLSLAGHLISAEQRRFGDESIRLLTGSPHLSGLRRLDLNISFLGEAGLRVLCDATSHLRPRFLNLANNHVTDSGAELLANWPGLENVEGLSLECNQIGPAGAMALARSPHLGSLRFLQLTQNPIPGLADRNRVEQTFIDRFGENVGIQW